MALANLLKTIWMIKHQNIPDPESVGRLRRDRLKRLLRHVMSKSDFYRSYYADHGITLDQIEDINLSDLPPIDKKMLMDNFDDLACDKTLKKDDLEDFISNPASKGTKYKNKYQVIHTSGSTGVLGIFVYGEKDWDVLRAMIITRFAKIGIKPFRKCRVAFFGAIDGNYAGVSLARSSPASFMKLILLEINSPLQQAIDSLNGFQPDVLITYNSGAYLLAQEQLRGNLKINPQKITGSGDPITPKIKETVYEAFGIYPVNCYLASESVVMAVECEEGDDLHLMDDWHCFEFVDDKLSPVEPGRQGNLIMTNLYNYTVPLIRYRMNDAMAVDNTPCSCGLPFSRIVKLSGRSEDTLWFTKADGSREFISPYTLIEFVVPGLVRYQFDQTSESSLLLRAVIRGDRASTLSALQKRMEEILGAKKLLEHVGFEVELVDGIRNDPKTGKFKFILPFRQN